MKLLLPVLLSPIVSFALSDEVTVDEKKARWVEFDFNGQKAAKNPAPDEPAPFSECLHVLVYGSPAEYEAGCTSRKIEDIRKLQKACDLSRNGAVNEYGDGYCRGRTGRSQLLFGWR